MSDLRAQLQSSLGSAYTLERELGGGGMSHTYVAQENALGRRVVVKILSPELAAGVSVDRFRREIQLVATLQHPHVVPVLATGDAAGLPWFTMPYVEGESLRARLGRGPLRIVEVTGILKDVARALEFAHSHGVVHRDIKPDNVLLAGSSATVTDFGIAKALSAARTPTQGTTLTMAGTSIGTPMYMAPEQAAGDPTLDQRSDIYSFGIMAYELLAGRPPFEGPTAVKLMSAHFSQRPRDVREIRADTPPALAELVMRCLEKEAGARPQSATDLVRVLETVTSSGTVDAAPAILHGQMQLGRALAFWTAATALVALTAWAATDVIGLPDWVFPGSLGIMLAGLPIIGFTWYVQRTAHRAYTATPTFTPGGTPSQQGTLASMVIKASPHVSWRRTWLGGAVAVGAFTVLVIGFMVMRALGIGPAGSLIGKGAFGRKETLIIADFRAPPGDSTLGQTIAEALRTDLGQSASLNVMTRAAVREILRLMQRPIEGVVNFDVAREIAARQGAKAVLDGEVNRLGQGYVVSARLVSSIDGEELAKFGQTASSEDALIGALGKLSRDIRGKIGESLKDIRDTKALERVSTSSLTALRKYVEGNRLIDEVGNVERGLGLLQEAVAIDSGFAMAWRKIAVVLNNNRTERPRMIDAASRAFQNRERLSETERLLTEAFYYTVGPTPDRDKALTAYQSLLEADSNNTTASNNVGVLLEQKREYAKALEFYRLGLKSPRPLGITFTNLMVAQIRVGDIAGVESTNVLYRQRLPENEGRWQGEWFVRWGKWDLAAADSIALAAFRATQRMQPQQRSAMNLSGTAYLRGRVRDGLRWKTEENKVVYRATRGDEQLIIAAVDSALMMSFFLGKSAEAQQIVRHALSRTPLSGLRPAARPWNRLGELGAILHDRQLARDALQGFEKDFDQLGLVQPEADRARMRAWVAVAEARYDDAVRDFHEADRGLAMFDRQAMIALADAYDLAGKADSALVHYQRFLDTRDAFSFIDGTYRAGAYKRAGELYEARGDTAKAEANYTKFIELWKDADPELQPKVQEVRERLARLRRGRG